jgi:hypothetical protein
MPDTRPGSYEAQVNPPVPHPDDEDKFKPPLPDELNADINLSDSFFPQAGQ